MEVVIERFITNELLFGSEETKIAPTESLITSGILDSMALLRLILFLEEQFGITVEDGEVLPDNFQTINHIKEFVESKKPN